MNTVPNRYQDKADYERTNIISDMLQGAMPANIIASYKKVYVDITHSVVHPGKPVGMLRVEYGLAKELSNLGFAIPVAWHSELRTMVKLPQDCIEDGSYKDAVTYAAQSQAIGSEDSGSILLLGSCYWWSNENFLKDLSSLVRQYNLVMIQFIHDIIWDKFSHWFPEGWVNATVKGTARILHECAGLMTYSRCAAHDIDIFCKKQSIPTPPITLCRAGDLFEETQIDYPGDLEDVLKPSEFILFVSSLQIRKNHRLLVALWRKLIQKHGSEKIPQLVCVSYPDEESEWFENETSRDPIFKGKIRLLRDLDDGQMNWLYKNCLFSVFPTLYEGWGMPVGESIAHGKICIATSASSVPEIAPEYTDLLDPRDFYAWMERLELYIFNEDARKNREKEISHYIPATWQDGSIEILHRLLNSNLHAPLPEIINYDQPIFDFTSGCNERYFGLGWNRYLKTGIFSRSPCATMIFRIPNPARGGILFLELSVDIPGSHLQILLDGKTVYTHRFQNKSNYTCQIRIPPHFDERDNQTAIVLEFKPIGRERLPGLYLKSATLGHAENLPSISSLLEMKCLCPQIVPCLYALLQKRQDVRKLSVLPGGSIALLLWAWRSGIGEENNLRLHWAEIKNALINLSTKPASNALVPSYSMLMDGIWVTDSDLWQWPRDKADGQKRIVEWFYSMGCNKYNLEEIIPKKIG